jgi:hypothetical protein
LGGSKCPYLPKINWILLNLFLLFFEKKNEEEGKEEEEEKGDEIPIPMLAGFTPL